MTTKPDTATRLVRKLNANTSRKFLSRQDITGKVSIYERVGQAWIWRAYFESPSNSPSLLELRRLVAE